MAEAYIHGVSTRVSKSHVSRLCAKLADGGCSTSVGAFSDRLLVEALQQIIQLQLHRLPSSTISGDNSVSRRCRLRRTA
jgi:hypothetical protein